MNRRLLLKTCSGLGAALVSSSAWINSLNKFWGLEIIFYDRLPEDIRSLYHRDFARAFPEWSLGGLLRELTRREIYSGGVFHVEGVRHNATHDPLVEFENFLYTESELLLYATIARLAVMQVGVIPVPAQVDAKSEAS